MQWLQSRVVKPTDTTTNQSTQGVATDFCFAEGPLKFFFTRYDQMQPFLRSDMFQCSPAGPHFLNEHISEHSEPTPKTSQPLIPRSDTPGTPDTCTGSPVTLSNGFAWTETVALMASCEVLGIAACNGSKGTACIASQYVGQALPVRMTQVFPDHSSSHGDLREVVRHFLPYLDNHIALLSGVNISCGFSHPVTQVSSLIPGDPELEGTVWDEDAEAVPCEILKELWRNSPSPQCIFQPTARVKGLPRKTSKSWATSCTESPPSREET